MGLAVARSARPISISVGALPWRASTSLAAPLGLNSDALGSNVTNSCTCPARGGVARGKAERYDGEDGRQDHSVSHGRHPPSRVNPARGRYTLRFPDLRHTTAPPPGPPSDAADGDGRTLGVDEPCPLVHPGHEQLHHPLHGLGSGVDLEVRDPPPRIVDVDLWWRTSGWFAAMWPIQSVSSAPSSTLLGLAGVSRIRRGLCTVMPG
jgi:hypothetical protein